MKYALSLLCLLIGIFVASAEAQSEFPLSSSSYRSSSGESLEGTSVNDCIGDYTGDAVGEVGNKYVDWESGHRSLTIVSGIDDLRSDSGPDTDMQSVNVSSMSEPPRLEFCGDFEYSCVAINAGLHGDICPERCIISPHIACGFCSRSPGPNGPETCICTE